MKTHTPSTDKCNTCTILKLQGKNKELEDHQKEAESLREQMKKEPEHCVTFNLQQVQALPFLKVNKAFYNRKTWMYDLGIHFNNRPYFFVWTENIASRGSKEILSCLMHFLLQYLTLDKSIDILIAWSDSCGGQNRNVNMVCFWLYVMEKFNIATIIHRFPLPGHSFLPNDAAFGDIE